MEPFKNEGLDLKKMPILEYFGQQYKHIYIICIIFAITGYIVYSNTFHVPFVFDGLTNILNNDKIRVTSIDVKSIIRAGIKSVAWRRPIANISFAMNYLIHDYSVRGYHVVNFTIHILNTILLYLLFKSTLVLSSEIYLEKNAILLSFVGALLWLVHPLNTQSVTYIVQRMTCMTAFFYLLTFMLYIWGRHAENIKKKYLYYIGSFIAGIFALGCKEISVTLPFFILLYEWFFFQDLKKEWIIKSLKYFLIIFIIISGVSLIYLGLSPIEKILTTYEVRDFTLKERVITQFRVVIYYISLILYPHPSRLNLDHDFILSESLINPITTLFSLLLIILSIVISIYKVKNYRLISFCIFWYFGNLALESSFIALEIIFEHRTYLPSMFLLFIPIILGFKYCKNGKMNGFIVSSILILLSIWTYQRNKVWGDSILLWQDCAKKSEKKVRPHYNLGNILLEKGRYDEAIEQYRKTIELDNKHVKGYNNIGIALAMQGKIDEAIKSYEAALAINNFHVNSINNLGIALAEKGNIQEAIDSYLRVLQINPMHEKAHFNLGIILTRNGKIIEAKEHFSEAIRTKPDFAEAHNELAGVFAKLGRKEEATKHLTMALELEPDLIGKRNESGYVLLGDGEAGNDIQFLAKKGEIRSTLAEAQNQIGVALAKQGKMEEAIIRIEKAIKYNPDNAEAYNDMGVIMAMKGNEAEAILRFNEALKNNENLFSAHDNLGRIYGQRGMLKEAIYHFSEAVRIRPDFAQAHKNLGLASLQNGKENKAIYYFDEALKIDPEFEEVHNDLGIVLAKQGKIEEAITHFEEALKINPDYQEAERNWQKANKVKNRKLGL